MRQARIAAMALGLGLLLILGGCATRPIDPPIAQASSKAGYRYETRPDRNKNSENLVILAFSGGGTRAAAFSYGVLEFLRRTELTAKDGRKVRLLDDVDVITGVSGGSFTALAYGLYGEDLFAEYEKRFLKRNVQGELIGQVVNPVNWPPLASPNWGRSELAAQLYDKILFNNATFSDLAQRPGPMIMVSATDITTGSRFVFNQAMFDVLCADLGTMPLSRAAAASSAVPVVMSPVTLNNYGGTCGDTIPDWAHQFLATPDPPRPAARAMRELKSLATLGDSRDRPYIHLVDGGVSDNLGMRSVLDALQILEASSIAGQSTVLDHKRRIIIVVVNSLSSPKLDWDKSEASPGTIGVLLNSTGVPIDRYSYESVELLKDTAARWQTMKRLRGSKVFSASKDPAVAALLRGPNADIYAIDVSFPQLKDKAEEEYLNAQPTSFALPDEAVDRLRAAAGTIISASPEFQRLLRDVGATMSEAPAVAGGPAM